MIRTCDALRVVTAPLRIHDPRPESRLNDVGEWTADDFSQGDAKLTINVSDVLKRSGGEYHVCFDLLEIKDLRFVIIKWVKLYGRKPGGDPVLLASSPDALGLSQPRLRSSVRNVECRLDVPETDPAMTLTLEIDLLAYDPGRVFPDDYPPKDRVCEGLVSLRRVYERGI